MGNIAKLEFLVAVHRLFGWFCLFFSFHSMCKLFTIANGQSPTITPFQFFFHENIIPIGGEDRNNNTFFDGNPLPNLRSFLEPCEILTLEMSCSEEEYEHNDDCLPQKTDNCDHSKELYCLSGVCLPNCHPHKEIYDHKEGTCFRKVGSDCRVTQNFTSTSVLVPPCERNAVCERDQCRCGKGFSYDNDFNKCVMYAGYNQFCNESMSCDTKSDIFCRENQCQCKSPSTQYFHLKRKRCYVLIGEVCSNGPQLCPDSSNCLKRSKSKVSQNKQGQINKSKFATDEKVGHDRLQKIFQDILEETEVFPDGEDEHFIGILEDDDGEMGEIKEFACKCDKGYGFTMDKRFCLGLYGSRCNTLHRCNSERGLKCYEGICVCSRERGNEQVYSELFQTCITVPGAVCNETAGDICAIGAVCNEGKCTCEDNLIALSESHSCAKSHGMLCEIENLNPFEPQCNNEVGLECNKNEGKCLCQSAEQFYDSNLGICRTFEEVQGKIPIVHFTPPDDREYKFRLGRNNCSKTFPINFVLYIIVIMILMIISCLPLS